MTSWYLTSESDSDEEDLLLLALAEQTTRKRLWVHDINKERKKYGEYHTLMRDLRNSPQRFFIYFRMPEACFDEILELIKEDITKQDTKYREAISAEERLAITLRFLATGDSYKTISHSYRVGFSTVAHIVKQVCYYICSRLQSTYMPVPTRQIWEASANMFHERWQFPNCVGSIDGKHVTIKSPPNSGSNYFCYLKKFSIVLLAIVGPDYKFIGVDIGGYGKNSDGGILEESSMGQKLSNNSLNIPPPKPLLEQNIPTPHVLIGDEAFALKTYLMRPFPRRSAREDNSKDNYNYRLCRARRVVENAFGILAKKWRIYDRPLEIDVETSKLVVKTTCILHNYLICKKADTFLHLLPSPTTTVFVNFDVDVRRAANVPFQIRDRFVNYFNNNNMNNNVV